MGVKHYALQDAKVFGRSKAELNETKKRMNALAHKEGLAPIKMNVRFSLALVTSLYMTVVQEFIRLGAREVVSTMNEISLQVIHVLCQQSLATDYYRN